MAAWKPPYVERRIDMGFYCRWYEKNMEDLEEWKQDACEENGQQCIYNDGSICQDLIENEDTEEKK